MVYNVVRLTLVLPHCWRDFMGVVLYRPGRAGLTLVLPHCWRDFMGVVLYRPGRAGALPIISKL